MFHPVQSSFPIKTEKQQGDEKEGLTDLSVNGEKGHGIGPDL